MRKTTYTRLVTDGERLYFQTRTRTEIDLKAVKKASELRAMYKSLGLPSKV